MILSLEWRLRIIRPCKGVACDGKNGKITLTIYISYLTGLLVSITNNDHCLLSLLTLKSCYTTFDCWALSYRFSVFCSVYNLYALRMVGVVSGVISETLVLST